MGDPKCMVLQGSLDVATQISSRIKCRMYLFYLWMGGSSQGRVMGTLWLRVWAGARPWWPLLAQLSVMCSWARSVTSLGLGFLTCKMSVTVVTTSWGVLCPRQIDSWGAPRYIMRTPCEILLLAVISVYDTWIATWGHAHSLKTSQMWFWFLQIVIYIFSPWRRPHHHPWGRWKSVGLCPSFFWSLLSHGKDPNGVECEFFHKACCDQVFACKEQVWVGWGCSLWRCYLGYSHVSHT